MSKLKYISILVFLVNMPNAFAGKKYIRDQNGLYHFVIRHDHSVRANSRRAQNKQAKLVQNPTILTCKQIGLVLGVGTLIAGSCLRLWASEVTK